MLLVTVGVSSQIKVSLYLLGRMSDQYHSPSSLEYMGTRTVVAKLLAAED